MVDHIHIVIESGGAYEDSWQKIHCAFFDHDKAKAYVETQESEADRCRYEYDEMLEFRNKWRSENPPPEYIPLIDRPRWSAGISEKQITPEMRQERARINAENSAIDARNRELRVDYEYRLTEATREYALSNGFNSDNVWYRPESSWRVEKIPVGDQKPNS